MTCALVPLADGVEEMEAVITIDILRRAGWKVVAAGLATGVVTAARGVRITPDCPLADAGADDFDALVLPGGAKGVENLRKDRRIVESVRQYSSADKLVCAVCAAPLVLHQAGILAGRRVTSHPSVALELNQSEWIDAPVVVDGNIVTSQGAGTTLAFALEIIRRMGDTKSATDISKAICAQDRPQSKRNASSHIVPA